MPTNKETKLILFCNIFLLWLNELSHKKCVTWLALPPSVICIADELKTRGDKNFLVAGYDSFGYSEEFNRPRRNRILEKKRCTMVMS